MKLLGTEGGIFVLAQRKRCEIVNASRYWTQTNKKGNGEVPFLMVISRDLGLDDQFWVKCKATREVKRPI